MLVHPVHMSDMSDMMPDSLPVVFGGIQCYTVVPSVYMQWHSGIEAVLHRVTQRKRQRLGTTAVSASFPDGLDHAAGHRWDLGPSNQ